MRDLAIMIKPASSLCNLRCEYCFYETVAENRSVYCRGMMTSDTVQQMLANIFCDLDPADHISFAFQGGEPTLAGLDFFRNFVARVQQINPGCTVSYQLQTNGILLDDTWCEFLKQNEFLVGLSLDCLQSVHDANRKDRTGKGTFAQVLEVKERLDRWQIDYNVLATLTRELAAQPENVWNFIRQNEIRFIQFTPCFGDMPCRIHPEDFAFFYGRLIGLWYEAWKKGEYISVKLIDDLVTLFATGRLTACGLTGNCSPQIIVEADGSVYPCDFYATDAWEIGNLCHKSIKEIYEDPKQAQFRCRKRSLPLCGNCRYKTICGGNCTVMQEHICYGKDASICGMQKLLDRHIKILLWVAQQQR